MKLSPFAFKPSNLALNSLLADFFLFLETSLTLFTYKQTEMLPFNFHLLISALKI